MDQKLCETINSIFRKFKGTFLIRLPKTPSPTLIRRCYVNSIEDRDIEAIMDSCRLLCNDDRVGWIQLNKILRFTDNYDGIIIDNENISILPEKLQTFIMSDMYGHHFASPDADRVINKLYTACVFNNIEVYCHKIKELNVKVSKKYMSMSPNKPGCFGCYQPGGVC